MKKRFRFQNQRLLKKVLKKANFRKIDLEEIWDDLQTVFNLFQDWVTGAYRKIPFASISAISLAFVYFLSPIDLIPDFIFGLGLVDDVAVFWILLNVIQADIEKYKVWKEAEDKRWDPEFMVEPDKVTVVSESSEQPSLPEETE